MGIFKKCCYFIGVVFIGMWMIKMIQQPDTDSFNKIISGMRENQIWALAGVVCFWIPAILNWAAEGMKIDTSAVKNLLREYIFPNFARAIPMWVQCIRAIGAGLFLYFLGNAFTVIDDKLELSFQYYLIAVLGGILFFGLPFIFPRKDQS